MIACNIFISGNRQNVGGAGHGTFKASEKLIAAGHNAGVHRRVMLFRWCEDWRAIAEHLSLIAGLHGEDLAIATHAYSWGAGWGAMQLARSLGRLGLGVKYMVLCDAVYRHPLCSLRWLSLFRRDVPLVGAPTIKIPHNVGEVFSFHQTQSRPQGHRLSPTNGTLVHPSVRLLRSHSYMDEAPEFHKLSLQVADRLADDVRLAAA